jgi:hypothetical protein
MESPCVRKEYRFWTFVDLLSSRAQSLREAHARGITKEQIIHALQIMPFVCELRQASIFNS